jgi:hypothetical protein
VRIVIALIVLSSIVRGSLAETTRAQATPIPYQAAAYAELFEGALEDIDGYWRAQFSGSGFAYRTPSVRWREVREPDACGTFDPHSGPGAYCPLDEAIVLSVPWYEQLMADGVDFAWVTVAAHEWGHHIQFLLGIQPGPGSTFELQADCLAGAYAQDAAGSGLLERGDITEAVGMSSSAGDPVWLPEDHPGGARQRGRAPDQLHARLHQRRGRLLAAPRRSSSRDPRSRDAAGRRATLVTPTLLAIESFLPQELQLAQGQSFRIESEGISTFDDMVAGLPAPERTRDLLVEWGWQENVYRVFCLGRPAAERGRLGFARHPPLCLGRRSGRSPAVLRGRPTGGAGVRAGGRGPVRGPDRGDGGAGRQRF